MYIDNCVPHGDAVAEITGSQVKMGSVSTAASSFILQSVLIEGAELAAREGTRTTFAFILTDKHGENQVTGYHGAELCIEDVFAFEENIAQCDILLLQQEVPCEVNEVAVQIAKKYNVKVILNPAPIRAISNEMAASVYLVTPNEHEKQAIDISRFHNVITTLGNRGCQINESKMIPAIQTRAVDTTGAGDTFNGVLAVCLAEGMEFAEACKYAVTASGISVSRRHVLNAIPYREEIERRMFRVK